MRISIWFGIFTFALGIFLSFLSNAMIATQTATVLQTTASIIATVIFVLFSAVMLGTGAGLVLHWIAGFGSPVRAFVLEVILSFALFFVGLGATIMSGNVWTGLQVFFTFFTASVAIFSLSFINLFGGMMEGIVQTKKFIYGKVRAWKK